jgi:hypothetical protein
MGYSFLHDVPCDWRWCVVPFDSASQKSSLTTVAQPLPLQSSPRKVFTRSSLTLSGVWYVPISTHSSQDEEEQALLLTLPRAPPFRCSFRPRTANRSSLHSPPAVRSTNTSAAADSKPPILFPSLDPPITVSSAEDPGLPSGCLIKASGRLQCRVEGSVSRWGA